MDRPKEIDRRPLRTREHRWAQALALFLVRCGWTPNGISILGMLVGILAGFCFAMTTSPRFTISGFLLGAVLVQARLLANMLDGMVAIAGEKYSPVGELYNEIPDRISDAAILIGAGYSLGGNPTLGYWTTILAILIAYIRAAGCVAGSPQCYMGPMAKPHRMFAITLAAIVSATLPTTWAFNLPMLPAPNLMAISLGIILLGEIITVCRRLLFIHSAVWRKHQERGAQ